MDSSSFLLFLILIGLAFTSGNDTLGYIGIGVTAIFLITMAGAHHVIIAIVALGIIYWGSQGADSQQMLVALMVVGALFLIFVLKGKEETQPGMEGMGMDYGLPMGY